jgi:hypothetical protein
MPVESPGGSWGKLRACPDVAPGISSVLRFASARGSNCPPGVGCQLTPPLKSREGNRRKWQCHCGTPPGTLEDFGWCPVPLYPHKKWHLPPFWGGATMLRGGRVPARYYRGHGTSIPKWNCFWHKHRGVRNGRSVCSARWSSFLRHGAEREAFVTNSSGGPGRE